MKIIIHRINTIKELKNIPKKYGVEVDIRGYGDKMFLSHEPIKNTEDYDQLEDYLKHYNHSFIIFNTKEAGYEDRIINLARKYKIRDYFLLDVEFPYLYKATREKGIRKIAIRYSEAEPIENLKSQIKNGTPLLDWVWIDTNTKLPVDKDLVEKLKQFKTCLVCPERWGRPEDISKYQEKIQKMKFQLNAVMTSLKYARSWEK